MPALNSAGAPLHAARPPAIPSARPAPLILDAAGAAVSCACAAHCLLLPAAAVLLPALGLGRLLGEEVERVLFGAALLIGTTRFGPAAWRAGRTGRGALPSLVFGVGVAVLVGVRLGAFGEADAGGMRERALVLVGATLVAGAHVASWRRERRCAARIAPHTALLLAAAAPTAGARAPRVPVQTACKLGDQTPARLSTSVPAPATPELRETEVLAPAASASRPRSA